MSYDIRLTHPATGETLMLDEPHQLIGGTYALGGTRECWLNVTYNYSHIFRRIMGPDGIRMIYGKTGAESAPLLRAAAEVLADDACENYWVATEGNVKKALLDLATLGRATAARSLERGLARRGKPIYTVGANTRTEGRDDEYATST